MNRTLVASLFLVACAVLLTSTLSFNDNKAQRRGDVFTSDGRMIQRQPTMTIADDADDNTMKKTTPSPPSSSSSSSSTLPTRRTTGSNSNVMSLPTIPLSSQRARYESWKRVQDSVDVEASARIIREHEQLCSAQKQRSSSKNRNEDADDDADAEDTRLLSSILASSSSSPDNKKRRRLEFEIFNFESNTITRTGFHRIFVAVVIVDDDDKKRRRRRLCNGGAIIEAALASDRDMIDVDFSVDIAPGLYEFQPFFRRGNGDEYRFCLALSFAPNADADGSTTNKKNGGRGGYKWRSTMETFRPPPSPLPPPTAGAAAKQKEAGSSSSSSSSWWWASATVKEFTTAQRLDPHCIGQSWSGRQCISRRITLDPASVAALEAHLTRLRGGKPCSSDVDGVDNDDDASSGDDNAFRSGAWMKLSECDQRDLCRGDLARVFPNSNGADLARTQLDNGGGGGVNNAKNTAEEESLFEPATRMMMNSNNKNKNKGWWVFVSDTCTVRLYTREEAWDVVNRHWILQWGDSTMKQPAANFLEYMLGVPVFGAAFMDNLESIRKVKRRPGFFSYRQYDVLRSWQLTAAKKVATKKLLRSTMCWGGCPALAAAPACGEAMAFNNRACAGQALAGKPALVAPGESSSSDQQQQQQSPYRADLPSAIVVNHFVWRWPKFNETSFILQVQDTLRWLEKSVSERLTEVAKASSSSVASTKAGGDGCAAAQQDDDDRRPVLIWMGGVRQLYADSESYLCSSENVAIFRRHLSWKVDAFFRSYQKEFRRRRRRRRRSQSRRKQQEKATKKTINTDNKNKPSCGDDAPPFRDVVFMSQHELTSPLHTGSEFGHFGVHYGATRGMCLTGASRSDRYAMSKCLRNATANWMMLQWWLNVLDRR